MVVWGTLFWLAFFLRSLDDEAEERGKEQEAHSRPLPVKKAKGSLSKGVLCFWQIRGGGGSCIAVGVQGMGDLLLPPFARMLGRYKISVVDKARMPHEGAG